MVSDQASWERYRLPAYPDIAAPDLPVLDEPARDKFCRVDADGKADALRRQYDRGVDADHLSARRHQRSPRITGIQRGIGLNHVIDQPTGRRSERASKRAHHSSSDRELEPVGVSDRDDQLSRSDRLGIALRSRDEVGRIDPDYRQVGIRIVTDQVRLKPPAIREGHLDFGGLLHDMTVRQDKAIRREDKTGPIAAHLTRAAWISRPTMSRLVVNFQIDDRRADLLRCGDYRLRIGIEKLLIGRGRLRQADFLSGPTVSCHQSENLLHGNPASVGTELTLII